jgi:single-stranded-DNA-specific exonuclease
LIKFGGHKTAAGVRLTLERLKGFQDAFEEAVERHVCGEDVQSILEVDSQVELSELSMPDYTMFLELLEPFGPGYSSPLFSAVDFSVTDSRVVGNSHLKLTVSPLKSPSQGNSRIDLVAWGHGDKLDLSWHEMEIAFIPTVNNWQGRKTLQLVLKDARPRKAV